ncbi:MAG: hypothetical protein K5694_03325 [Bacilli bacterium]|nr:hypothetical protein [Bacilli bacterium]
MSDKINLYALTKGVRGKLTKVDFEDDLGETEGKVRITASVTTNSYDDGIFLEIIAYASGTVHCFATFDELDPTLESLRLINEFNDNNSWFAGYITTINGKQFFQVHYSVIECADTDNAVYNVERFFDYLVDDDIAEKLSPITRLTH